MERNRLQWESALAMRKAVEQVKEYGCKVMAQCVAMVHKAIGTFGYFEYEYWETSSWYACVGN